MLTKLSLRGFRGFGREINFDCDGDAIILVGSNGTGKTSFFDGLQWGLFGEITRLKGSRDSVGDDYVRNRFLREGTPEVSVHLSDRDRSIVVRRTKRTVRVVDGNGIEHAGAAAAREIEGLMHVGNSNGTSAAEAFDRLFLLGQDEITKFVRDTKPRERFDSLSSLLGLNVVRRFYERTDSWRDVVAARLSMAESRLIQEEQALDQLRLDRTARQVRARQASRISVARLAREAEEVLAAASSDAILPHTADVPSLDLIAASLDETVARLAAAEEAASSALSEAESLLRSKPSVARLRVRVPNLARLARASSARLEKAVSARDAASSDVGKAESILRSLNLEIERLAHEEDAFAEFLRESERWIDHEVCPVCEQAISPQHVVSRLHQRVAVRRMTSKGLIRRRAAAEKRALEAGNRLAKAEEVAAAEEGRYRVRSNDHASAAREVDAWDAATAALKERWVTRSGRLESVIPAIRRESRRLRSLAPNARRLLTFADSLRAREDVRVIRKEEAERRREYKARLAERDELRSAFRLVEKVDHDAKAAEISIVRSTLNRQMPTLRAVYQRLRPHPVFDDLRIDFKQFKDRGEVYYRAARDDVSGNVSMMFSAAQLNAVAICIFVSLNLTRPRGGLDWLLMDDPIQNMDDYNVLGLVDLLRSVRGRRQVIVSTHDEQLGELFRRKLRPQSDGERTVVHRFIASDRDGPHLITTRDEYAPERSVLPDIASD